MQHGRGQGEAAYNNKKGGRGEGEQVLTGEDDDVASCSCDLLRLEDQAGVVCRVRANFDDDTLGRDQGGAGGELYARKRE